MVKIINLVKNEKMVEHQFLSDLYDSNWFIRPKVVVNLDVVW